MTNLTRIVAVIVNTKKAILYKEDGTTVELLQGDKRLRPILEKATPLLETQKWADVDLSEENTWKEFEEKTNGAVRLFRVAKAKLAGLFKGKDQPDIVGPTSVGTIPTPTATAQKQVAVAEILKHATPVSHPSFNEQKVAKQRPVVEGHGSTPSDRSETGRDAHYDNHEDTIVAVTPKGNVVVGVERIKSQFDAVVKSGEGKGLTVFLERLAAVSNKRQHTSDELLRFMERGDLPIANDGTILIYKRLNRRQDAFYDVHSGRVKQKVGSYVHMDEKMVDHNRRNECSNGLHVARRGYIRHFSGDVIVLAKVRPEDVIAVPNYDANKMRVCGYHIIAELTPEQFQAIIRNRPISDADGGAELLGKAIAGDHIGITQMVKITGADGTGLEITDVFPDGESALAAEVSTSAPQAEVAEVGADDEEDPTPAPAPKVTNKIKKTVSKRAKKAKRKVAVKKAVATTSAKKVRPLEAAGIGRGDEPVDVRAVQKLKGGNDQALKLDKPAPITQTDVVKAMWDGALSGVPGKAQELLDFKKKAKKGWAVWGLPENAGETLKALLG